MTIESAMALKRLNSCKRSRKKQDDVAKYLEEPLRLMVKQIGRSRFMRDQFYYGDVSMYKSSLLDVSDSLLIVIDIQPSFVQKEAGEGDSALHQRMCWVIKVANWLKVPLVVTAEDIPGNGSVSDEVAEALPPDTKIYNKMTFGLTAQADILKAVQKTGRKTAVLIGYETDVCITHSALGLIDLGYKVAVVADATGSPGDAHHIGLERIRGAGGIIVSAKSLYYEWVRTVEKANDFEALGIETPEGILL